MSISRLRTELARDGIFNVRDIGGVETSSGSAVVSGRVLRGDALQRVRSSADAFAASGVVRVVDLRDEAEITRSGQIDVPGIEVVHHAIIDPLFEWGPSPDIERSQLLVVRYRQILADSGARLSGAISSIAEGLHSAPAVAFHCAIGKDRTGLLAALLLGLLGVGSEAIVDDYARSGAATAVQAQWLWSLGLIGGDEVDDEDLSIGLWSARPETMVQTLGWLDAEYGGPAGYLSHYGLDPLTMEDLRRQLLVA